MVPFLASVLINAIRNLNANIAINVRACCGVCGCLGCAGKETERGGAHALLKR